MQPIDDWNRLLNHRVAVVTGGGAGIGAAIARLFAQHGAFVEIAEIDPALGEATVAAIRDAGGAARAHRIDVREADEVETLRAAVLDRHGGLDVLVNNVGDYRPFSTFRKSSPASWDAQYQLNLQHVFTVTHAFLPALIERERASILNVHSVEGMRGYPGDPVYGAFKAALAHFTTCLALELGRKGVRVNGIGPDLTQTPQVDYRAGYEEHEHLWPSWAPVGRCGEPEDQARVALFLVSDAGGFVTGHNVPVDGGSLAGGGWFWSPTERRWVNRPKGL